MNIMFPSASILVFWVLLILVTASLPGIVKAMKLQEVITPTMIQTIRAVIVASLIVTLVGFVTAIFGAFIPV